MRTAKILGMVLAALAIGAAAAWFYIRHAADRKWAAAQERIRQLSADHPIVVPPLPPTPASKALQIHFVAAIREAALRKGRADEARVLVFSKKPGGIVDGVLDDAQAFLQLLHQAARASAAAPEDFPPGWRVDWDGDTLRFMLFSCVLRARQLREQKAPFDAAITLLDAVQLSRFWAVSGREDHLHDVAWGLGPCLKELTGILSQETLSRNHLLQLERELEPIDGAFLSPFDSLKPILARWAEGLESLNLKETFMMDRAAYRWRYGLPEALMKAQAFEACESHAQMLAACRDQPYAEFARRRRRIAVEMEDTKNPLLEWQYALGRVGWSALDRRAEVRLLRVAARYRATGEILAIQDPFGDKILHAQTGRRMKFWSLGHGSEYHCGAAESHLLLEVDPPAPE